MKKIHTLSIIIFLALISFISLNENAFALTVSPAKLEIASDPGTTLSGVIKLYNERDTQQTFYTSFENFEPSDDSGKPRFVGNNDGLATWVSVQKSVTLSPKQHLEVPFDIQIPAGVEPGGYFSAIFFGTQQPDLQGGSLSIGGRIGVLTLLRVNGDIPEEGGLLDYKTTDGTFFYDMPPVSLEYRFSNDGGDRVSPKGDVEFKNTFGTVRATINANPQEGSILPSSARRFNLVWGAEKPQGFFNKVSAQWNNFHIGWYSAQLNLGWGFTNQTTSESLSILIVPWQLLMVLIAAFIVLRFALKFAGKRYKANLLKEIEKNKSTEE